MHHIVMDSRSYLRSSFPPAPKHDDGCIVVLVAVSDAFLRGSLHRDKTVISENPLVYDTAMSPEETAETIKRFAVKAVQSMDCQDAVTLLNSWKAGGKGNPFLPPLFHYTVGASQNVTGFRTRNTAWVFGLLSRHLLGWFQSAPENIRKALKGLL